MTSGHCRRVASPVTIINADLHSVALFAWASATARIRTQALAGAAMKWITREHVKVDRVACPWLIRKYIDPEAEFLFVPAADVPAVAEREGARVSGTPPAGRNQPGSAVCGTEVRTLAHPPLTNRGGVRRAEGPETAAQAAQHGRIERESRLTS